MKLALGVNFTTARKMASLWRSVAGPVSTKNHLYNTNFLRKSNSRLGPYKSALIAAPRLLLRGAAIEKWPQ